MKAYGSNWRLGIVITCACFFIFTIMDICIKWVGTRCPVMETFFILSSVGSLTIGGRIFFRYGTKGFQTLHMKVHLVRGPLNFLHFMLVIYALPRTTLADFYALIFAIPLFVSLLSAIILKDYPGYQRWLATIVGFLGVLVVLRPSMTISLGELSVLIAAALYSVTIILMRYANRDSSAVIMFYMMFNALPLAFIGMLFNHQSLSLADLSVLAFSGFLYGLGNLALAEGFRLATTSLAAPFQYMQLLYGIPLGYFIWHELPDAYTWIGGAVIVGSGLYLLRHESRTEKVPVA